MDVHITDLEDNTDFTVILITPRIAGCRCDSWYHVGMIEFLNRAQTTEVRDAWEKWRENTGIQDSSVQYKVLRPYS